MDIFHKGHLASHWNNGLLGPHHISVSGEKYLPDRFQADFSFVGAMLWVSFTMFLSVSGFMAVSWIGAGGSGAALLAVASADCYPFCGV